MVLLQPVWFLVRRLLLAFMVVFLNTALIWQVALMTATVFTQVIILGRVQPFVLLSQYRYEMFNECVVMLVMYHFLLFTPFVEDLEVRFQLGYSVCGLICLHLAVSIFLIVKDNFNDLRKKRLIHKASGAHDS